jgi:hypothetical protein
LFFDLVSIEDTHEPATVAQDDRKFLHQKV